MRLAVAVLLLCSCVHIRDKGTTLVPVAPAGVTAAAKSRRIALLIGIDSFEDRRFSALKYAAQDALAMAQAVEHFDEVIVRTAAAETTRAAILQTLSDITKRITNSRDTLVIYISSHGSLGQRPGEPLARFLVTSDTRLDLVAETGISVDALVRTVETLHAKRVALILATCHSGAGKSQISDSLAEALRRHKAPLGFLHERSEAILLTTAAAFGESARESDELRHDVYTHFLLQGMRDGDRDADGAVTLSEAHDYARERTFAYTNGAQRPTIESSILGSDPIVLRGNPQKRGRPLLYSYAQSATGIQVFVDGTAKGTLPGGVVLEPGAHRIELRDAYSGASLYRGTVSLNEGAREELSALIPPRPRVLIGVESTTEIPLSSTAARFFPTATGASVRLGISRWPHRLLEPSLRVSVLDGRGGEEIFGGAVNTSLLVGRFEAVLGFRIRLAPRWMIIPMLELGMLAARRELRNQGFYAEQAMSGFTFGGQLAAAFTPLDWLRLELHTGVHGLVAAIDDRQGPFPLLSVGFMIGVTP